MKRFLIFYSALHATAFCRYEFRYWKAFYFINGVIDLRLCLLHVLLQSGGFGNSDHVIQ